MIRELSGIKIGKRRKESVSRKIFLFFNTLVITLISLTFILPYINILAKSLNAARDTMLGGLTFYPRDLTWDNYKVIFGNPSTWSGLKVSVLRVIVGSLFSMMIQYMVAYALTRKKLPFRRGIVIYFTIPMFLSGGLISEYVFFSKLGVLNTFWVYIFPASFSFYNMVIIRTYLQGIPEALIESARLDGASEFKILYSLMIPLSMPIVATILLWCAVSHWNDWTRTLYFVENRDLYTLQYNLQLAIKQADTVQDMIQQAIESGRPLGDIDADITGESIQAAQMIFTTLPIVCLYPFLQKYFMSGVMIGSVKE